MAVAVAVRFDFVDSKGKTSFTKIRIPNGFSIADYQEFAQAAAQVISNISVVRITRTSLCFSLDLSTATLRAVAASGADIAQKAYFSFNTATSGFRKRLRIPTLDETKVPVGSDAIDLTDVDVAALVDAMNNGIVVTGGTIAPCDSRTNDLTAVGEAREVFRGT